MALTITSGGSLGTALGLTLLAWGIRALRGAALRSFLEDTSHRFNLKGLHFLLSRFGRKQKKQQVCISPAAFRFLVESKPVPFVVFQVFREEKKRGSLMQRNGSLSVSGQSNQHQQQQQQASARSSPYSSATNSFRGGSLTRSFEEDANFEETEEEEITSRFTQGSDNSSSSLRTAATPSTAAAGGGGGGGEAESSTSVFESESEEVQRLPEHVLRGLLIRSISPRVRYPVPTHRPSFTAGFPLSKSGNVETHNHSQHNYTNTAYNNSSNNSHSETNKTERLLDERDLQQQRISKTDLVVLLSDDISNDEDDKDSPTKNKRNNNRQRRVHIEHLTGFSCELGYRCVYVQGGIQALKTLRREGEEIKESGSEYDSLDNELQSLSRDAIFSLMYLHKTSHLRHSSSSESLSLHNHNHPTSSTAAAGVGEDSSNGNNGSNKAKRRRRRVEVHIFDVRRHDELVLFGAFEGASHLLNMHLPHSLHLSVEDWQKKYRNFNKPRTSDIVIFICNTGLRSKWAAKLFQDFGYRKVYFAQGGTNVWHLEQTLCSYESYDFGSSDIPVPRPFPLEQVNFERGQRQLTRTGLLKYLMEGPASDAASGGHSNHHQKG